MLNLMCAQQKKKSPNRHRWWIFVYILKSQTDTFWHRIKWKERKSETKPQPHKIYVAHISCWTILNAQTERMGKFTHKNLNVGKENAEEEEENDGMSFHSSWKKK